MRLTLVHTSDLHGRMDERRAQKLKNLAEEADLYLDSGDVVRFGNVAVPLSPDATWGWMSQAGCLAGVPGNREFHVLSQVFRKKLQGCQHLLLAANLHWNGPARKPLLSGEVLRYRGNRVRVLRLEKKSPLPGAVVWNGVGILGLMVPMVTSRMLARKVSAFWHTSPEESAGLWIPLLQKECDVLIALCHLGLDQEKHLASTVSGIHIILGGHTHETLPQPIRVKETWIAHSGSHGRWAGFYRWENGRLTGEIVSLGEQTRR